MVAFELEEGFLDHGGRGFSAVAAEFFDGGDDEFRRAILGVRGVGEEPGVGAFLRCAGEHGLAVFVEPGLVGAIEERAVGVVDGLPVVVEGGAGGVGGSGFAGDGEAEVGEKFLLRCPG